jgi:hypothetical protein
LLSFVGADDLQLYPEVIYSVCCGYSGREPNDYHRVPGRWISCNQPYERPCGCLCYVTCSFQSYQTKLRGDKRRLRLKNNKGVEQMDVTCRKLIICSQSCLVSKRLSSSINVDTARQKSLGVICSDLEESNFKKICKW